jgi:hypothetical protein
MRAGLQKSYSGLAGNETIVATVPYDFLKSIDRGRATRAR